MHGAILNRDWYPYYITPFGWTYARIIQHEGATVEWVLMLHGCIQQISSQEWQRHWWGLLKYSIIRSLLSGLLVHAPITVSILTWEVRPDTACLFFEDVSAFEGLTLLAKHDWNGSAMGRGNTSQLLLITWDQRIYEILHDQGITVDRLHRHAYLTCKIVTDLILSVHIKTVRIPFSFDRWLDICQHVVVLMRGQWLSDLLLDAEWIAGFQRSCPLRLFVILTANLTVMLELVVKFSLWKCGPSRRHTHFAHRHPPVLILQIKVRDHSLQFLYSDLLLVKLIL